MLNINEFEYFGPFFLHVINGIIHSVFRESISKKQSGLHFLYFLRKWPKNCVCKPSFSSTAYETIKVFSKSSSFIHSFIHLPYPLIPKLKHFDHGKLYVDTRTHELWNISTNTRNIEVRAWFHVWLQMRRNSCIPLPSFILQSWHTTLHSHADACLLNCKSKVCSWLMTSEFCLKKKLFKLLTLCGKRCRHTFYFSKLTLIYWQMTEISL